MQLEREFKMWPLCKVLSVCSRSGEKWLWEENKGHLTVSPGLEQLHFYCTKSAMLEYHVNLFPGQLWLSQNGNKAMDFLLQNCNRLKASFTSRFLGLGCHSKQFVGMSGFAGQAFWLRGRGNQTNVYSSSEEGSGLTLLFPSLVKW